MALAGWGARVRCALRNRRWANRGGLGAMMIICPSCRAAHVQRTLFCEQCGTSLIGVALVAEGGATDGIEFRPPDGVAVTPGADALGAAAPARDGVGRMPTGSMNNDP